MILQTSGQVRNLADTHTNIHAYMHTLSHKRKDAWKLTFP